MAGNIPSGPPALYSPKEFIAQNVVLTKTWKNFRNFEKQIYSGKKKS
jgi:hypothetical protein